VDEYPKKKKPWTIKLDMEYVSKLLGEKIPATSAKKILTSLGFAAKGNEKQLEVEVPTFRLDALTQEDLIEEIGRIYGYEKIRPIAPLIPVTSPKINEKRTFERNLKNILAANGFSEVLNYAFYGQDDAGFSGSDHFELEMPPSPQHAFLRTSLVPNFLRNVAENLKRDKELHIFELGKIFLPVGETLPAEKTILMGAMVFDKKNSPKERADKRTESGFFQAKSIVDNILLQLGIADQYFDNFKADAIEFPNSFWHESRSSEIKIEGSGKSFGFLGEINPLVLGQFGISARVVMFEFDAEKLLEISQQEREYLPIGKYPVVTRDISMIAQKNVRIDDILKVIQSVGGDIVRDVDLFDAIDFADNTSSFAFHLILGADDRTLTGNEIDGVMNSIMDKLESTLAVKMRK
ncbi:MAG: hypothetical protein PHW24_05150, partial [Candidatus Moranbacteria bacterium]|nr:hypothetical protein [Candidatus Moranbacteria bacterium]